MKNELCKYDNWMMSPIDLFFNSFNNDFENIFDANIQYPMDVYEDKDSLHIEMAVVGMNKEDIDISTNDNTIKIKGEHKNKIDQEEYDKRKYAQKKISRKHFEFVFKLTSKIDINNLNVTLENGLLSIVMPFKEESKFKKIELK